ncbi:MAG: glycosylase [Eubacterium sp.]|nr:glycosylase [Eubacterium sp.]
MVSWLKDAVFYEIYPQSFNDTNGDGIGDIQGIIEKLDYIKDLGANAIWINPWYDSPFKDAGYDVRNYKLVAPRYGTNEDAKRLFVEASKRDMHIILDLVPGHTSEEHPWFIESGKPIVDADGNEAKNEFSDRYIWSDFWLGSIAGHPYIGGECDRNGTYMLNFFKCQPALNYGFAEPKEKWQMSYQDEEPGKTLEAMMDVMRFWLDMGASGFRVDMADSLVKDDDDKKSCTSKIWHKVREMLDAEYPEAVMVSEWSNPLLAINGAGYHMDFYLNHIGNGYNTLLRDHESEGEDRTYFKKNADGDITRFLTDFIPKYEGTKDKGYISFLTCNHDTPRASRTLDESELKIAYATLLTLPGVPFIYYGDEIGMRYIENLPTKEGGYTRTGTRTPMQWEAYADSSSEGGTAGVGGSSAGDINMGFSTAAPDRLYLPIDPEGPSVREQQARPDSLYNTVKEILRIRHAEKSLNADADFEVILGEKDKPFIYRRGEIVIVVNPSEREMSFEANVLIDALSRSEKTIGLDDRTIYKTGSIDIIEDRLVVSPQCFVMLR